MTLLSGGRANDFNGRGPVYGPGLGEVDHASLGPGSCHNKLSTFYNIYYTGGRGDL